MDTGVNLNEHQPESSYELQISVEGCAGHEDAARDAAGEPRGEASTAMGGRRS